MHMYIYTYIHIYTDIHIYEQVIYIETCRTLSQSGQCVYTRIYARTYADVC